MTVHDPRGRFRQWPARPPSCRRAPGTPRSSRRASGARGGCRPRCGPAPRRAGSRPRPVHVAVGDRCGDVLGGTGEPGVRRGRHDGVGPSLERCMRAAVPLDRGAAQRSRHRRWCAGPATTARSARGRSARARGCCAAGCAPARRRRSRRQPDARTAPRRSSTTTPASGSARTTSPRPSCTPTATTATRATTPAATVSARPYLDENSRVGRTCPCSQNRRWRPS